MKFTDLVVLFTIVLLNIFFWTSANLPRHLVEPSAPIEGLSFNPYAIDQTPESENHPSGEQLDRDLQVISNFTKTVRIYGADDWIKPLPQIAEKYKMNIVASAWIDGNREANKKHIEDVVQMARFNRNVKRVIIGNETQLATMIGLPQIIPREELVSYLRDARQRLRTPVATAEPWDYWINNPEMVDEVDFIAIHVLPYWLGIPIDQAVDYVVGKYLAVRNTFPNKFIYLAETGWPSDGPQKVKRFPRLSIRPVLSANSSSAPRRKASHTIWSRPSTSRGRAKERAASVNTGDFGMRIENRNSPLKGALSRTSIGRNGPSRPRSSQLQPRYSFCPASGHSTSRARP